MTDQRVTGGKSAEVDLHASQVVTQNQELVRAKAAADAAEAQSKEELKVVKKKLSDAKATSAKLRDELARTTSELQEEQAKRTDAGVHLLLHLNTRASRRCNPVATILAL